MREKLIELIRREVPSPFAERIADHLIEGGVEIPVRCKECHHLMFSDCYGECYKQLRIVTPEDFCSFGERKDDERKD